MQLYYYESNQKCFDCFQQFKQQTERLNMNGEMICKLMLIRNMCAESLRYIFQYRKWVEKNCMLKKNSAWKNLAYAGLDEELPILSNNRLRLGNAKDASWFLYTNPKDSVPLGLCDNTFNFGKTNH